MDTKSGYPFWVLKNGLLPTYPQVERDQRCDVVVIGGGISGALIADELSRHGHEVIVVEQRDIGWGSTAASTALIQYEIDVHMTELAKRFDEATAALAYTTCVTATEALTALSRDLRDVGFQRCDSVYLASKARDLATLEAERQLRARHGITSRMLGADDVFERYAITAPGALRSRPAAVLDPYRFTCRLLARAHRRGVAIFDRTKIDRLRKTARGVTVRTDHGYEIRAGHAIVAAGYAAQSWLSKRVAKNRSTYAFISDALAPAKLAHLTRTIFWETARPYHYVRSTTDHRVLVGGEDQPVDRPAVRDAQVHMRANKLHRYAAKLFPGLELTQAFAWAGTFAETPDGLPYFGPHRQHGDRVLFAMAYGGNGITYSQLGAGLLRAIIERTPHALRELYSFER
jgi:glycine/D-amino acid oxidase-like deaminating enzyme